MLGAQDERSSAVIPEAHASQSGVLTRYQGEKRINRLSPRSHRAAPLRTERSAQTHLTPRARHKHRRRAKLRGAAIGLTRRMCSQHRGGQGKRRKRAPRGEKKKTRKERGDHRVGAPRDDTRKAGTPKVRRPPGADQAWRTPTAADNGGQPPVHSQEGRGDATQPPLGRGARGHGPQHQREGRPQRTEREVRRLRRGVMAPPPRQGQGGVAGGKPGVRLPEERPPPYGAPHRRPPRRYQGEVAGIAASRAQAGS